MLIRTLGKLPFPWCLVRIAILAISMFALSSCKSDDSEGLATLARLERHERVEINGKLVSEAWFSGPRVASQQYDDGLVKSDFRTDGNHISFADYGKSNPFCIFDTANHISNFTPFHQSVSNYPGVVPPRDIGKDVGRYTTHEIQDFWSVFQLPYKSGSHKESGGSDIYSFVLGSTLKVPYEYIFDVEIGNNAKNPRFEI